MSYHSHGQFPNCSVTAIVLQEWFYVLTCDISEAGECYTFGSNQFSQLGYNTEYKKDRFPEKVEALIISMVACGDTFSVVVTKGGYLCISRPTVGHRKCISSQCLTLFFYFRFDGLMDFDLLIHDNNNIEAFIMRHVSQVEY